MAGVPKTRVFDLRAIDQLCLAALGVAAKRGAKVVSSADIVLARKHVLL